MSSSAVVPDLVRFDALATRAAGVQVRLAQEYAAWLGVLEAAEREAHLVPRGGSAGPRVSRTDVAVAEIACATRLSERAVGADLALAVRWVRDHPQVAAALRTTVTDPVLEVEVPVLTRDKVAVLDRLTRDLDRDATDRVVARVLPRAEADTPGEFGARIRRVLPVVADEELAARRRRAVDARRVGVRPEDDGTCSLLAFGLPAAYAVAVDRALSDLARRGTDQGVGRSLTQRRVDALLTCVLGPAALLPSPEPLLFGTPADDARWGEPPAADVPAPVDDRRCRDLLAQVQDLLAQVDLTVPWAPRCRVEVVLDTRYGDGVGELEGFGPLDGHALTDLLARADRARVTDVAGVADGTGDPTYRPSAATARHVTARDRRCRWSGCTRRASRCDIDHAMPYGVGGPTHHANLHTLCRRHHRIKHQTPWHLDLTRDGTARWTSPTGRRYTTRPPGVDDEPP